MSQAHTGKLAVVLTASIGLVIGGVAPVVSSSTSLATNMRIVDDTGTISISVPVTWEDTDTSPLTNAGGTIPRVLAAPDRREFEENFAEGVSYELHPHGQHQEGLITALGDTGDCADDYRLVEFDNGVFTGPGWWWSECPANGDASLVIVTPDAEAMWTAVVQVQAANAEISVIEDVLCSISLEAGADSDADSSNGDYYGTSPSINADQPISTDLTDETFAPSEVPIHCD